MRRRRGNWASAPRRRSRRWRRAVEWFSGAATGLRANLPHDAHPDGGRGRHGVPRHPAARSRRGPGELASRLVALAPAWQVRTVCWSPTEPERNAPPRPSMPHCRLPRGAIVSIGFCGALDPDLEIGDVIAGTAVAAGSHTFPALCPAQRASAIDAGVVCSIDHVAADRGREAPPARGRARSPWRWKPAAWRNAPKHAACRSTV